MLSSPAGSVPHEVRHLTPLSGQGADFAPEMPLAAVSAPGRIRTCDIRLRRPALCPTELRGRGRRSVAPAAAANYDPAPPCQWRSVLVKIRQLGLIIFREHKIGYAVPKLQVVLRGTRGVAEGPARGANGRGSSGRFPVRLLFSGCLRGAEGELIRECGEPEIAEPRPDPPCGRRRSHPPRRGHALWLGRGREPVAVLGGRAKGEVREATEQLRLLGRSPRADAVGAVLRQERRD
jgi:hypothetical protein